MAEMTLRMMIAAGVLDEVPATIVQDGNPYNRLHARRSGYGYGFHEASINPYSTLLDEPYYGHSLHDTGYYGGYGSPYPMDPYSSLSGRLFNRYPYSNLDLYQLYNNPLAVSPYGRYSPRGYGYRGRDYGYGYGNRYPSGHAQPWGNYGHAQPWGNYGHAQPWGNYGYAQPWDNYGYTQPWDSYGGISPWNQGYDYGGVGPYSSYPNSLYDSWTSPWANPWSVPWNSGWPGVTFDPSSLSTPVNSYVPLQSSVLTPMTGAPAMFPSGRNPWSASPASYGSVPARSGPLLQWRQSLVRPYVTTGRIPLGYGNSEPAVRARHIPPAGVAIPGNTLPGQATTIPPPFDWDAASSPQPVQSDAPNIFNEQLEGLWVTEDGEYLGLRGKQFLWTDGKELYEKGTLTATADTLVAHSHGSSSAITYQYRLDENELLTVGQDGKIREYDRIPLDAGIAMLPENALQPPGQQLQPSPSAQEEAKLTQ